MDRLSINLADYGIQARGAQYGSSSQEEVAALNKALEATDITGRQTTNLTDASGAPLKVESLERTLKHLTFRESDIVLWKNLPKKAAYNTVEEYNQLASYGADRGGFTNEGELPDEEDSIYIRRAQLVKYLGVTKSVTHQMTLVNTMVGNIMERTIKDGTLWILRKLNKSLYYGNSDIIPQEFNGLLAQQLQSDAWSGLDAYLNSENVIDLRGRGLTEDPIETAANSIVENYGLGTELYAPPAVLSDFVKTFYGNKFIQPNTAQTSAGIMGQRVQTFDSQFGRIGLNYDVFFKKAPFKVAGAQSTHPKSPAAPVWDTAAPATVVADVTTSKFNSEDAGNYIYAIAAINRHGESSLVVNETPVAVTAGSVVDLKFSIVDNAHPATGYRVYRSKKGGDKTSKLYPIFDISVAQLKMGYAGAAGDLCRDNNYFLPDCDQAFLVQFDNEVIEFAQLAPLMKMDLAILSPAYRFMVLLYGTPFLYAPKKLVRLINIGRASN